MGARVTELWRARRRDEAAFPEVAQRVPRGRGVRHTRRRRFRGPRRGDARAGSAAVAKRPRRELWAAAGDDVPRRVLLHRGALLDRRARHDSSARVQRGIRRLLRLERPLHVSLHRNVEGERHDAFWRARADDRRASRARRRSPDSFGTCAHPLHVSSRTSDGHDRRAHERGPGDRTAIRLSAAFAGARSLPALERCKAHPAPDDASPHPAGRVLASRAAMPRALRFSCGLSDSRRRLAHARRSRRSRAALRDGSRGPRLRARSGLGRTRRGREEESPGVTTRERHGRRAEVCPRAPHQRAEASRDLRPRSESVSQTLCRRTCSCAVCESWISTTRRSRSRRS